MVIFIMTNAVKLSIKLKLKAKMKHSFGQFVAIFKFRNGQFWPISADTLANLSFSYLVWRHKNLNIITKKLLYECFVRCRLLYCLTVWGSTYQSKLKPLVNILKKSWRQIRPKKQDTKTRLKKQ